MAHSRFIIYADESGSPVLSADEADFPIFVLVFMIVDKAVYVDRIVPSIQRLKFDFVGHDQLILHERDIRRQAGSFSFLQVSADLRQRFLQRLNEIVEAADIKLACAIIDKRKLRERYTNPWSPYDIALTFCMEKSAKFINGHGESDTEVNVIFEARGRTEDNHLELEFLRIASGKPRIGRALPVVSGFKWIPRFVDKRSNSAGLQLADLAARPIGLGHLRPDQPNRARDVLWPKLAFPHPKIFPN